MQHDRERTTDGPAPRRAGRLAPALTNKPSALARSFTS